MGNAYYYSPEKMLSPCLLYKKLKVNTYKTIMLPAVLYGSETWSLTLREQQMFRMFENNILRKIFGTKRNEITEEWSCLKLSYTHCILRLT